MWYGVFEEAQHYSYCIQKLTVLMHMDTELVCQQYQVHQAISEETSYISLYTYMATNIRNHFDGLH